MKKVITMVGTSMFENYIKEKDDTIFRKYIENLKEKRASEYENEKGRIKRVKEKLQPWIKDNENASAEIKSLIKLKQELKEDFEIYLFSSDTVLSKLAGEILKEKLNQFDELSRDNIYLQEIKNLQIWNKKNFSEGMVNLINKMYEIAGGYWDNIIVNITGGYKATIPYLTILAQVNKYPIYYIFEETDALINVPYIPLSINWEVFNENEEFFLGLEKEGISEMPLGTKHREEIESLIETADNLICLNPLGVTLWEKYKQRFNIFFISKEVDDKIGGFDENYKRIIKKSFLELERRLKENPDHPDLDHRLSNVDLPPGFKTFKHKENNLQVRILYKVEKEKTTYGSIELDIYIGLIAIGSEVHNVESEYVEEFKRKSHEVQNIENYNSYRIEREV